MFLDFVWTQERNVAAVKIQLLVRSFLQERRAKRQNQAAVIIQSVWRGYAARNRLRLKKEAQLRARQHEAATVIQVGAFYICEDEMALYLINISIFVLIFRID